MQNKARFHLFYVIIIIGVLLSHLKGFANSRPDEGELEMMVLDQNFDPDKMTGPPNGQGGWVVVEPLNVNVSRESGEIELVSYRERRKPWSQYFSISYSMFSPTNLEPNVGAFAFSDIYDDNADVPLIEVQFHFKRNFRSAGSLALEIGVGYYKNKSDVEFLDSELEVIPLKIGATYILDTLFATPHISPYISAGGYVVKYTESQGTTSFNGTTQVAPYASFGINVDIGRVDKSSADIAYIESGIENTALFFEGRKFFASAAEADPNFETELHGNGGFRLEF